MLRELILIGGSPHGARPKALVDDNRASARMTAGGPGGARSADDQAWLIKFPARGEHTETCAVEELYARLARECGIDMPETQFFALGRGLSAFGTRRFDPAGLLRVPSKDRNFNATVGVIRRHPSASIVDLARKTPDKPPKTRPGTPVVCACGHLGGGRLPRRWPQARIAMRCNGWAA